VTLYVRRGGSVSFQIKEGGDDFVLALAQPVRISRVSIRCDSLGAVVCQYSVSLVGN
jgi:hypothetical protein